MSKTLDSVAVNLTVNGEPRSIAVEPRTTLLDALREQLALTGTKKGCDRGECGACTVHVDGRRVLSCMTLAAMQAGKHIATIEGLEHDGKLHPLQAAFIEHDGFQCGFCTSGQIMSGKALLMRNPNPTEAQVRRALSGNLCRCGNYNREVAAVLAAAKTR
jgi:xanthine dehydrogenase YagT iron-sulfur-binding subunit